MDSRNLVDREALAELAAQINSAFVRTSDLATLNGAPLINGGEDITISGAGGAVVPTFSGMVSIPAAQIGAQSLSTPTAVYFNTETSAFVATTDIIASDKPNCAANWNGADLWGVPTATGRTPVRNGLYLNVKTARLFYWTGTTLTTLTPETAAAPSSPSGDVWIDVAIPLSDFTEANITTRIAAYPIEQLTAMSYADIRCARGVRIDSLGELHFLPWRFMNDEGSYIITDDLFVNDSRYRVEIEFGEITLTKRE